MATPANEWRGLQQRNCKTEISVVEIKSCFGFGMSGFFYYWGKWARCGNTTLNTEPLPGSLFTSIFPLSFCTMP